MDHLWSKFTQFLRCPIFAEGISRCATVKDKQSENFKCFSEFINSLANEFDAAFISLNHDNLITQARSNLFTGFNENTGEFDPASIHERGNFNLIYHLHGSIHFDYKDDVPLNQIYWNKNPSIEAKHSQFKMTSPNLEGINQPISTIIAGYGKTNQIQAVPFRTYYSKLDNIAAQSDAFLFLGYGFNDPHINNSLYSIKNERNKPVVVIDWANDKDENEDATKTLRDRKDTWATMLNRTIRFDRHFMQMEGLKHVPPEVSTLKKSKIFEISSLEDYPLAVWYNGFIEACKNYEKISEKLKSKI